MPEIQPNMDDIHNYMNSCQQGEKIMNLCAEKMTNRETEEQQSNGSTCALREPDPDTCGIGCFKPRWIQGWATPRVYLVLYTLIGMLMEMFFTYRVGVLTTLEKRFEIRSKTSGILMMVDELVPIILGAQLGYLGGKTHRPRMFGMTLLVMVFGTFMFTLPYFMYGPARQVGGHEDKTEYRPEMCVAGDVESCEADVRETTNAAVAIFIIGGFLRGFGIVAYQSIGLSYLDDIAEKKHTALYFGLTCSAKSVGPTVGYLLASFLLKYPEDPTSEPEFGLQDPRWIGAWWVGFLFQGLVLFLLTLPLFLFPWRLPAQKKPPEVTERSLKDYWAAMKRLIKNPVYICLVATFCLQTIGTEGHLVLLPKYMEQQFRLSASDANLYAGPLNMVPIMLSSAIGGFLVWKLRPSAKTQISVMITVETVSTIGYLLLMIPSCEQMDMHSFGTDATGLILEGPCNSNCNCSTQVFTPMCGADSKTLYFSPCFAGCTDHMNNSYTDCACALDVAARKGHVTPGFCLSDDCWTRAVQYMIFYPLIQFCVSLFRMQYLVLMIRSIRPEDKSFGLAFFETCLCFFALVPFFIVSGSLVDTSCLVWEQVCGKTGNCWFYDTDRFNKLLHGVASAFTGIAVFGLVVPHVLSKRLGDLYDDEEDIEGPAGVKGGIQNPGFEDPIKF